MGNQNQKSALVSGAGWIGHFTGLLIDEMHEQGFTDQQIHALVNGTKPSQNMLRQIVRGIKESQAPTFKEGEYAISLSNEEAIAWLIEKRKLDQASAITLITRWGALATELGYSGPIAWKVRAGFTLKQHAPQAGPCYEKFEYLQNWNFTDEPTKDCLVFWIPVIIPATRSKNKDEQLAVLAGLRGTKFPKHHLSDFGSAALLTTLILSEFKHSGKRVPENCDWVRTDTCGSDGDLLCLGSFDDGGLHCSGWWDDDRRSSYGAFALGVELEA